MSAGDERTCMLPGQAGLQRALVYEAVEQTFSTSEGERHDGATMSDGVVRVSAEVAAAEAARDAGRS